MMSPQDLVTLKRVDSPAVSSDGAGFVRHWDAWETPGNDSRSFVFGLDPAGKIGGAGVAIDGPPGTLTGDTPTKPFGGNEDVAWSADSKGVYFAARQADRHEPTSTNIDVWHSPLGGGAPHNLTADNKGTDTLPTPSPDGNWLASAAMARPGYEADRLVVHGGPQGSFNDSWSFRWNPRLSASQGSAVVAVDFHGSTGYGQAFTALQRRQIPSELLVFPEENHWVLKPKDSLQWHATVFAWLARYLQPGN